LCFRVRVKVRVRVRVRVSVRARARVRVRAGFSVNTFLIKRVFDQCSRSEKMTRKIAKKDLKIARLFR